MKKVMWFSRHEMTAEQKSALGPAEVTKVMIENLPNVYSWVDADINGETTRIMMADYVKNFDVIAIVAPIGLQKQFLDISGERPVIIAENIRTLVKTEDMGEDKVVFNFGGWKRIKKIEVVIENYIP